MAENNTRNDKKDKNLPDVLAYNTAGIPLAMGVFIVTKDQLIKQIDSLASTYIGGEYSVKIDSWVDNSSTVYDTERKTNQNPVRNSFQIWIPNSNKTIVNQSADSGNVFVRDGIVEYNEDFKKFVNTYGLQGDKGNAIEMLGRKNGKLIVLIDPVKIFGLFFDMTSKAYNDENPGNKNTKYCEVYTTTVYEGDNPMDVALGKARRGRKSSNISCFVVRKVYKSYGGGEDKYRPAFSARKHRDD